MTGFPSLVAILSLSYRHRIERSRVLRSTTTGSYVIRWHVEVRK
jgi:hypothetical protein